MVIEMTCPNCFSVKIGLVCINVLKVYSLGWSLDVIPLNP